MPPKAVIIATGSEVEIALKVQAELETGGRPTRVVSMPSMELFAAQLSEYRESVLPRGVKRGWRSRRRIRVLVRWLARMVLRSGSRSSGRVRRTSGSYEEYGSR